MGINHCYRISLLSWGGLLVSAIALGMLSPLERFPWLACFLFVPLAYMLRPGTQMGILKGMMAGWAFGTMSWAAGTWWVLNSMDILLGLNAWQPWAAATLFWLYQGLPFALFGAVCCWLNTGNRPAGPVFCASLLTLLLFFRPPVCPVSSVVSVALWPAFIQIADLGGEYLVCFALILVNWLIADLLSHLGRGGIYRTMTSLLAIFVLLSAVLGYGTWRISLIRETAQRPGMSKLSVASLQPNVPVRWERDSLKAYETSEALCLRALTAHQGIIRGSGLLVFPELPEFSCKSGEFESSGLKSALQRLGIPVLLSGDEYVIAPGDAQVQTADNGLRMIVTRGISAKYNSVYTMPPGENCSVAYRKVKLVPFSEMTPLSTSFPWLKKIVGQSLEFSRGDGPHLIDIGDLSVQPLICFESGFSDLVHPDADILVEVSDDGWFSSRDAEMKHLGMGIFRTVEFRRPLVRSSNSGGGAHLQATGEIVPETLTPHQKAWVTRAELYCPDTVTLFARFGYNWLWVPGLIVLLKIGIPLAGVRWKE